MAEDTAAKVEAALDSHVHADGIDGEESYRRELAAKAFQGICDHVKARWSEKGRRDA